MSSKKPLIVDCADLPQVMPNQPLLTSHQAGWQSIQLAHYCQSTLDLPEIANPQHIVILPLGHDAVEGEFISEGRIYPLSYGQLDYASGCIQVFPANLPYKVYADPRCRRLEFVHCYLEPIFLAQIAHESVNPDRVELIFEIKRKDLLIQQIGLALKASLAADGIGSRFYADSMATALSAHLIRHYATRKHGLRDYQDGMPQQKLRQALEYIHGHLGENLSLSEIADELGMSQYYFCRLFKKTIGVAPHQYLMQQRIERAKQLLRQPALTITAVASECGFTHQSHFAKCFRRATGLTPKQFRQL